MVPVFIYVDRAIRMTNINKILSDCKIVWVWVNDSRVSLIRFSDRAIRMTNINISIQFEFLIYKNQINDINAALAAHSCMGLGKHGLTHWDPRSTGLANELIDLWQVHTKLQPHLAYILWNCSGVDVNNLEAILVMTWHRQGAFQIQYGIF